MKTQLNHKINICAVFGESALICQMCQKWLAKICAGDFLLDNASHSSRPVETDSNQMGTWSENNLHYTMREISGILKICKSSFENHLYQLGYINCFDVWVPHKWIRPSWLYFCMWFSTCNENILLLKQIVTGDEKWILYNNVEWNRSWNHHQSYQRPVFI